MARLNYYLIGAALGGTIGARIRGSVGPMTYERMVRKMARSLREREPFVTELRDRGSASSRFVKRLRAALEASRSGFSPDRVLADPELNESFIDRCRTFGLENDPFTLNRSLLQLRKAGELRGLNSKHTIVRDQWRFAYASEIAGRAICLRHGVSIDTMICHPKLVQQFDRLAATLAPGPTAFERRWCALNIRKRGLAGVESARRRLRYLQWSSLRLLQESYDVPARPGLGELFENDQLLLVCESGNLCETADRHRILIDLPVLERSLWSPSSERLFWRYAMADERDAGTSSLVSALVGRYAPVFNIPRAVRIQAA